MATVSYNTGSKRWTHFHSALQLAIQRAANKWTYEDFAECFTLWCEEQPDGAKGVFSGVARHIENEITKNCEAIFNEYNVKPNIDILHAIVTEARARKQSGGTGTDVWKEGIEPQAATRARALPSLEKEATKLRTTLAQIEQENLQLQTQMQSNVHERNEVDAKVTELLDILDEVYEQWSKLPLDEMDSWTLQTMEASAPRLP
ncbi:hypothetical protein FIBSPDRAFT_1038201 [Athelia psychrophila]|uniref:Nnf1-domain-containing protein n=1 Tax=Athelia psychrophila TaxID=1759441 RepID=A0A166TEV3_9AGAM|nr:hypothetical protein FIBSPDRAFT_1038201 [Fibularhizoctonia sp. CBS 109695]